MPFLVVQSMAVAALAVLRKIGGEINMAYECSSNGKDLKCCGFGAAIFHIGIYTTKGDKCCRRGDDERQIFNCCVGNVASPGKFIAPQRLTSGAYVKVQKRTIVEKLERVVTKACAASRQHFVYMDRSMFSFDQHFNIGSNTLLHNCIMKQSAEERKKRCINVRVENKGAQIIKAETTNDWGDVKCSGKTNSKDCHPWGRLHSGQSCYMVMVMGGTIRIDAVDDGRGAFEFHIPQSTKMVAKGHIHGPSFNCEAATG